MSAQDYPITFPYGATSSPYSPAHPHRGDDRNCPMDTPVVVGDTVIGLTGMTGFSLNIPHLHIQEWKGNKATVRKPQNSFEGGTVVEVDVNGTTGDKSFGKYVTIQTDDGWRDSYCHLSEVKVKVGDIIGGSMTDAQISKMFNDRDKRMDKIETDLGSLYVIVDSLAKRVDKLEKTTTPPTAVVDGNYHIGPVEG